MKKCRYCNYTARWQGLCFACFEQSGEGDKYRSERAARDEAEREAEAAEQHRAALAIITDLHDAGKEWWEISERLNALRYLHHGTPWSSDVVRNVYLATTGESWDD